LRPKADAANLTGKLAYGSDDDGVQFKYKVIRMWQQPVETFLQGGLGLLPLATLCQMPANKALTDALREVVREIDRRLGKETSHAEAVRLMNASLILTGLRVRKDEAEVVYQGVQNMSELTAYDEMIEEIDKGIAKGRIEGRIEGELRGRIRLLQRQGRNKFGPPDAATEAALTAIQDLDRLDRLADAVFTATSWQELLATR
jgi:predicted transposase YdaD